MSNKLKESSLTAIADSKEQKPFDLEQFGLQTIRKSLPFGDYSAVGLESILCIERKSLADFVHSVTSARKTMDKRILAMRSYRYSFLICEFSMKDLLEKKYNGGANEMSLIGTLTRYQSRGISVLNADNGYVASRVCARLIYFVAREVYQFANLFDVTAGTANRQGAAENG